MVQFGTKLQTNKNPRWRDYYVDYDGLKHTIKKVSKRLDIIRKASLNLDNTSTAVFNVGDLSVGNGIIQEEEEEDAERYALSEGEEEGGKSLRATRIGRRANTLDYRDIESNSFDEGSQLLGSRSGSADGDDSYGSLPEVGKKSQKNKKKMRQHNFSLDLGRSNDQNGHDVRGFQIELLRENPDQIFVDHLKNEAEKVNKFYQKKLSELKDRIIQLNLTVSSLNRTYLNLDPDVEDESAVLSKDVLAADSAKRAYRDAYREMQLLNNFAILNYTAFVKIIKKHDKATGLKTRKMLMIHINKYKDGFVNSTELHRLVDSVEKTMAKTYFNNNLTMARSELLLKHHTLQSWEMMHIGLRVGIVLVLCFWVVWDVAVDEFMRPEEAQLPAEVARVFRGFGYFVVGFWLWAACLYVWDIDRINHTYLFEFDPRRSLIWQEALSKATSVTITYLFLLLLYMKISRGEVFSLSPIAAKYVPLMLFAYMTTLLIFPVDQTAVILNALFRVVCSPFYEVTFFTALVGDVLTSLAKPLVDVAFTVCFFFTGEWHRLYDLDEPSLDPHQSSCMDGFEFNRIVAPLVISFPLLCRLNQNLRRYYDTRKRVPHLLNASKYLAAHSVVLLGALHPSLSSVENNSYYKLAWVVAFTGSTLFTYFWDVRIDWGLGDPKYKYLREQRMLTDERIYYIAMVGDFFLRFSWSLTLIPQVTIALGAGITSSYFILFLGTMELIRRAVWCVIRVEYEHLYNAQGYRRVDYVPLHFEMTENTSKRHKSKYSVMLELVGFTSVIVGFFIFAFATGDTKTSFKKN